MTERVFLSIHTGPAHSMATMIPRVIEPFLQACAGLLAHEPTRTISLEIWAVDGQVHFLIHCDRVWAPILTQQLYACYPMVLIEELAEAPGELGSGQTLAVASVGFSPEDGALKVADGEPTETLQAIIDVLGQLPADDHAIVQLVLATAQERVSPLGEFFKGLRDDFLIEAKRSLLGIAPAEKDDAPNPKRDQALFRAGIRVAVRRQASYQTAVATLDQLAATFHQFTQPDQARCEVKQPKRPGRWLQEFQARARGRETGFLLTATEASQLFHLPFAMQGSRAIRQLPSLVLPPPPVDEAVARRGLKLGTARYRGQTQPVYLDSEDRLRHLYLIGQTGTGKSTLFQGGALQDILRGDGCCFIDPHGEAIDWLLPRIPRERLDDVLLFDPSDSAGLLGLNLLEWQTPAERDLLIQELIHLFYKLFDPNRTGLIGTQFEHWLRSAALTVTEPDVRGTLVDIPRLFVDDGFRQAVVRRVVHPEAQAFWRDQMGQTAAFHKSEMLNYFTSKFGSFLGNQTLRTIVGQRHSAFHFRALMDKRKIVLVNLSKGKLGELNAQLLGIILLAKIQMAAMSRADVPPSARAPFYVYIDEFQTLATDAFASMLSELRKYGVALHLTHQYADQLSPSIRQAIAGNVGTLLALRLGIEDAEWLAPHFQPLTYDDLTHVPAHHFHVRTLSAGRALVPFTARADLAHHPASLEVAAAIRQRMHAFVAAYAQAPHRLRQPTLAGTHS